MKRRVNRNSLLNERKESNSAISRYSIDSSRAKLCSKTRYNESVSKDVTHVTILDEYYGGKVKPVPFNYFLEGFDYDIEFEIE